MSTVTDGWNSWYKEEVHYGGKVPDDAVFILGVEVVKDWGYGEHFGEAVFRLSNGLYVGISCGCSCDFGSWYISDPQDTAFNAGMQLGQVFMHKYGDDIKAL